MREDEIPKWTDSRRWRQSRYVGCAILTACMAMLFLAGVIFGAILRGRL